MIASGAILSGFTTRLQTLWRGRKRLPVRKATPTE
jgi:hypothetical protein